MPKRISLLLTVALLGVALLNVALSGALSAQSPYSNWKNGPPTDPNFFPIGVWLQSPSNAKKYQAIGINTYVGLWQGPTDAQLQALKAAGIHVVAHQNRTALNSKHVSAMRAWSQMDEPDNAQPKSGGGYGPPITPATVVSRYNAMRKADGTRPVFLNFGQGVAHENWNGRGTRTGKLQDYPEYMKGADIVSFDIYPVTHNESAIRGKLEYVARGVERLVGWAKGKKPVWNFIECTHIGSTVMPTPAEVKAEVWMSITHGSMGILYFCHEWKPSFSDAGVLRYPKMTDAITVINAEIRALARVLNSPTDSSGASVTSSKTTVPIKHMVKRHGGATYLFAVGMRRDKTTGTFNVTGLPAQSIATVIGEDREISVVNGVFRDDFDPYGVHLYRILPKTLEGSPKKIPVSTGGKHKLQLAAGATHANRGYLVLASLSGTLPGSDLGSLTLPLNFDAVTENTLLAPNGIIAGSLGLLNAQGRAAAEVRVPRLGAAWIGTTLNLAYVSFTGWTVNMVSNPVGFTLVR